MEEGGEPEDQPQIKFSADVTNKYEILQELGAGAYSVVFRVKKKTTGETLALKHIDSRQAPENTARQVAHETSMMKLAGAQCRNVVRCWDLILEKMEDKPIFNVVIDEFAGGDLIDGFNRIWQEGRQVPDAQLAFVTLQMMTAIQHIHSLHIVHLDVKGENFLCDRPNIADPHVVIALADFGMARMLEPGQTLDESCGTTAFWAPEVFAGKPGHKADIWAVGVTTFVLGSMRQPFTDEGIEEEVCRKGGPQIDYPFSMSAECKEFIKACLISDPDERFDASTALKNDWLVQAPKRRMDRPNCFTEVYLCTSKVVGEIVCCFAGIIKCLVVCAVESVSAGINAGKEKRLDNGRAVTCDEYVSAHKEDGLSTDELRARWASLEIFEEPQEEAKVPLAATTNEAAPAPAPAKAVAYALPANK